MWPFYALIATTAVVGSFVVTYQPGAPSSEVAEVQAEELARNMAVYRDAVVHHVSKHKGTTGTVPDEALDFPAWYVRNPNWTNRVDSNGLIAVYSTSRMPPAVSTKIAKLSHGSVLAGKKDKIRGKDSVAAPRQADTRVDVPDSLLGGLLEGVPVWLAKAD